MPVRKVWWIASCAVCGIIAGFIALAFAAANEPALPAVAVAIISPGLRVAELVMPERQHSLGWTFGWFLRIAIAINAVFYFVLFAVLARLATRGARKSQQR